MKQVQNSHKLLLHEIIGAGMFTGYLPIAPGSWGSWSAACMMWILCNIFLLPVWQVSLIGFLLTFFLGVYSSRIIASISNKKDPSFIVIDEFAGIFLTYLLVPLSIKNFFLGFFLFRVFDIIKPWPIRHVETLKGGWGIMLDDTLAASYAGLTLLIIHLLS